MFVRAQTIAITLLTFAAVGCGSFETDGTEASNRLRAGNGFRVRTQKSFEAPLAPGGLRLTLTNDLPKLEVPEDQLASATQLNAKICSTPPLNARRMVRTEDGNEIYESAKGEARCLLLSPTVWAATSQVYVLTPEQVSSLLNEEFTQLRVTFKSHDQWSTWYYGCWAAKPAYIEPKADVENEAQVTVTRQNELSFTCH